MDQNWAKHEAKIVEVDKRGLDTQKRIAHLEEAFRKADIEGLTRKVGGGGGVISSCGFISQRVLTKLFRKSQFLHKSVNSSIIRSCLQPCTPHLPARHPFTVPECGVLARELI